VEHCNFEWLPVLSGIPQGTVLGPILFILFIDDIGAIFSGSVIHELFADDMKLYITIDTNLDRCSLQSAFDRLLLWCCNWQLSINVGKWYIGKIGKSCILVKLLIIIPMCLIDVKLMTHVLYLGNRN